MKLTHRQAGSLRSPLLPLSTVVPEAPRRQLRLRCSAVTSVPRKRAPAPSTSRPLETEPASSSGSSLASVSSSIDAPTSSQDEFGQDPASSSASLLASMDDAYHDVIASVQETVHEAEVAVEQAWTASPVGRAWAWYNAKLQDSPIRTKAVTSFFGFVLGDVMAQKIGGACHAVSKLDSCIIPKHHLARTARIYAARLTSAHPLPPSCRRPPSAMPTTRIPLQVAACKRSGRSGSACTACWSTVRRVTPGIRCDTLLMFGHR